MTVIAERFRANRIANFTESVIRDMTRRALEHGAVNLAQGFPDFAAPEPIKRAAIEAIEADNNQYSITWGAKPFRQAIADKYRRHYGVDLDPEREITVCCGSTEGMIAVLLATANPDDEIVLFEPYYENYLPDSDLCSAKRKLVSLKAPDWSFDEAELRAAFSSKTKACIVNTPNNPTGKVFTRSELSLIAQLCQQHDALLITDEIYEHILYDGTEHVTPITLPGMRERSVVINSMSKTYSVTGWRVGWVIAPPAVTDSIRKVHDFLTVGAASPLQAAGILALQLPDSYYVELSAKYEEKRNLLLQILGHAGFDCLTPKGAYYIMADIRGFGFPTDREFAMHLVREIGVSCVPGSSFFDHQEMGASYLRFCFCKKEATLQAAGDRLAKLGARV
jgi:aspartate/methionine/tyrosine aminotransferase